ncbi:MAG: Fe-S cluster assembly protein SufD [Acidobacteriia bacterium]|nr:Fe-S cluster assembly protein SufD [Terriglobia bacterium]
MIKAIQRLDHYLESFTAFEKTAAGQGLPWLRQLRRNAFARFCEVGFPTAHDEDWRFTNVSAIAQTPFLLGGNNRARPLQLELEPYQVPGFACQLVFLNGRFAPELSSLGKLPVWLEVSSLADQIVRNPGVIEPHLGQYVDIRRDAFCALNTAFVEDGAYIHIRRSAAAEEPIYLLFVSTANDTPTMGHPRNLIWAEENSQVTVVEDYVSLGGGTAFTNAVTELVAGDHAVVSHYMVEREHVHSYSVSTLRIQQGRGANIASHSILTGGALVRNNVHPVLAGEGGECLINGLFIGNGRQHLDNYMLVEHRSPHCASRQFYNGILDGHAHGVFHGRIVVHKDAQKTDAKQTNRNLLLSDDAQIDTKPQLEIHADDVKCTHGATIGQIEEDALFYLRSRGIDELSARRLLLLAFASECLDRMKPGPARTHVEALINRNLLQMGDSAPDLAQDLSSSEVERNWSEIG